MNTSCMLLSSVLLLVGCAATPNPDRSSIEAVAGPARAAPAAPAETRQDPEGSTASDDPGPAPVLVGAVGGQGIEVDEFLSRLWMRDSTRVREVLEQIVFERLTLLEAERLGLGISPEAVEEVLSEAYASMGAMLSENGSGLSVTEHIRDNLGMDPAFYERHLRSDAIVQLLAERCVRAWALENERTVVQVMELEHGGVLAQVQEGLQAGRSFDELAAEHGADRSAEGLARLSIVRSEGHPLARLAFATPEGAVGGPLAQGGGYLLIRVVERLAPEPIEAGAANLSRVEASLAAAEVDNLEFVQWRAAMVRRYRVNLTPLFDLVGDPGPQ